MIEPTSEQLAQCFYFSLEDRALLLKETKPHNLLGMGIQLGTLRFLGSFLSGSFYGMIPHIAVSKTTANHTL